MHARGERADFTPEALSQDLKQVYSEPEKQSNEAPLFSV